MILYKVMKIVFSGGEDLHSGKMHDAAVPTSLVLVLLGQRKQTQLGANRKIDNGLMTDRLL